MSKRQRSRGGLAARSQPRPASGLLASVFGIGTGRRANRSTKAPDPVTEDAAAEKRARRLERNRDLRELGAFESGERPAAPANRTIANPGGERRRNRERREAQEKAENEARAEAALEERRKLADKARSS